MVDTLMAVGSHRLAADVMPFRAGQYLFRFNVRRPGIASKRGERQWVLAESP
jgi:hypothetical protein